MIPASNSSSQRSGKPNQFLGVLLHTRAISGLSHMRTELAPLLIVLIHDPGIGSLRRHPDVARPHPNIETLNLYQGGAMIERNITLPEMILWTGTRFKNTSLRAF